MFFWMSMKLKKQILMRNLLPWAAGVKEVPVVATMQHRAQRTRRRDPQAAHTYVARNSVRVHWSEAIRERRAGKELE